jgi:general secretion pathway protein G
MRTRRPQGFTLVEILIVVVILGILAAIVIPQFTSASQEAIRGALQSQMQTISSQVELYRVQNAGQLPDLDANPVGVSSEENGWGVMVAGEFLKEQPFNGFTNSSSLAIGTEGDQLAAGSRTGGGWIFHDDSTADYGTVFALGYDGTNLATETGYTEADTIP